jgi:hypothetical protein
LPVAAVSADNDAAKASLVEAAIASWPTIHGDAEYPYAILRGYGNNGVVNGRSMTQTTECTQREFFSYVGMRSLVTSAVDRLVGSGTSLDQLNNDLRLVRAELQWDLVASREYFYALSLLGCIGFSDDLVRSVVDSGGEISLQPLIDDLSH